MRIATVSLIDRGLLSVQGEMLVTAQDTAPALVQRTIEKALLEKFKTPDKATAIFNDRGLEFACAEYEHSLTHLGLLPGPADKDARQRRFSTVLLVLVGAAGIKLIIALIHGRHNVGFLIGMAGVASVLNQTTRHWHTG